LLDQDTKIERLERLSRLLESGALTKSEFDQEKLAALGFGATDGADGRPHNVYVRAALYKSLFAILLIVALGVGAVFWIHSETKPEVLYQPNKLNGTLSAGSLSTPTIPARAEISASAKPEPQPSSIVSENWLIGGWIAVGENCASDGGVTYSSDGTWTAYGVSGSWKLKNDTLVTFVKERMNDQDEWQKVSPPERSVEKFMSTKKNEYRSVEADGSKFHNKRCPRT
jgi:hypothetical protein